MNFISQYSVPLTVAGMTILSAALSSLPAPTDASGMLYRWFYKFGNTLMANVSAVRGKAQYEDAKPPTAKENTL